MEGIIILQNDGEIIVCESLNQVWELQNYKPTGKEGEEALRTWCHVKGYKYHISTRGLKKPIIIPKETL